MTSGRIRKAKAVRRPTRLGLALAALAVLGAAGLVAPAHAGQRTAVIPTQTIYPGETIVGSKLEEVDVTNPNVVEGFAGRISDVVGKVSKRTLLPGRVIMTSAVREAYAVERGTTVQMVVAVGTLRISAKGSPLQDAAVGDLIQLRNIDSGVIVAGTVMSDGTVEVVTK
ncbi:flagella basal body P-ring formation protein FlgA [Rhizobium sp. RU20A]|uniref:flagellar basal body P-ring formation chaperone FlgA n=1 Tax=Rhizobium sp. RU20A TaxID=1907412 RepID=UPI00095423A8|nr:flagellar basal body P-ring formation chaperone FlgA [Rhizobium sp. RU20A]SIQ55958.1 flagella basal body P-ring formation protein FlgA [Rhizobium sp. RU20A]